MVVKISVGSFIYNKKSNNFTAEISELTKIDKIDINPGIDSIELTNPKTNKSQVFEFTHADKDGSDEDTYGWRYKSKEGVNLLIIND